MINTKLLKIKLCNLYDKIIGDIQNGIQKEICKLLTQKHNELNLHIHMAFIDFKMPLIESTETI
jgi:hypothetical protein